MTDTLERTDDLTDIVGDFAPKCSLILAWRTGQKQCENDAAWVGYTRCCKLEVLVCEEHKTCDLPYTCRGCRRQHDDLANWSRL